MSEVADRSVLSLMFIASEVDMTQWVLVGHAERLLEAILGMQGFLFGALQQVHRRRLVEDAI